jgi:beta-lactam-binding protein with PASTA domain
VSFQKRALSAVINIGIVVAVAIVFVAGLVLAVYLSLRSPEVRVPDIVGKDLASAELTLSQSGLNLRRRAVRVSSSAKPDTVLDQVPHAGEVVKKGQTVAVDISRASAQGENTSANSEEKQSTDANSNEGKEKRPQSDSRNQNSNLNKNRNTNRGNTNLVSNGNANRPMRSANSNLRLVSSNVGSDSSSRTNSNVQSNRPTNGNTRPSRRANSNIPR